MFYNIQHLKVCLTYDLVSLGPVKAQVVPEIVKELGWKIVSRYVNTAQNICNFCCKKLI